MTRPYLVQTVLLPLHESLEKKGQLPFSQLHSHVVNLSRASVSSSIKWKYTVLSGRGAVIVFSLLYIPGSSRCLLNCNSFPSAHKSKPLFINLGKDGKKAPSFTVQLLLLDHARKAAKLILFCQKPESHPCFFADKRAAWGIPPG